MGRWTTVVDHDGSEFQCWAGDDRWDVLKVGEAVPREKVRGWHDGVDYFRPGVLHVGDGVYEADRDKVPAAPGWVGPVYRSEHVPGVVLRETTREERAELGDEGFWVVVKDGKVLGVRRRTQNEGWRDDASLSRYAEFEREHLVVKYGIEPPDPGLWSEFDWAMAAVERRHEELEKAKWDAENFGKTPQERALFGIGMFMRSRMKEDGFLAKIMPPTDADAPKPPPPPPTPTQLLAEKFRARTAGQTMTPEELLAEVNRYCGGNPDAVVAVLAQVEKWRHELGWTDTAIREAIPQAGLSAPHTGPVPSGITKKDLQDAVAAGVGGITRKDLQEAAAVRLDRGPDNKYVKWAEKEPLLNRLFPALAQADLPEVGPDQPVRVLDPEPAERTDQDRIRDAIRSDAPPRTPPHLTEFFAYEGPGDSYGHTARLAKADFAGPPPAAEPATPPAVEIPFKDLPPGLFIRGPRYPVHFGPGPALSTEEFKRLCEEQDRRFAEENEPGRTELADYFVDKPADGSYFNRGQGRPWPYEGGGSLSIEVFPFLKGKPFDNLAVRVLAALKPTYLRATTGEWTCDAIGGRVSVTLEEDGRTIRGVSQELPVHGACGHDVAVAWRKRYGASPGG